VQCIYRSCTADGWVQRRPDYRRQCNARGISRERAAIDEWARELAPSEDLRRWYGHDPERFPEFSRRYHAELATRREQLSRLRRRARSGVVTLVFAARDTEHSNAAVLSDALRGGRP
jgi:uncharacterized protein YeaO (DUF488 family)